MRLRSLPFLIKQGWKSLAANRLMSLASIGVLTACLILTGIATLLSVDINRMVDLLGENNEIVVYLDDSLSEEEIQDLRTTFAGFDNVIEVAYTNKSEAYEEMLGFMENYAALLSGLDGVFPASLRVRLENQELLAQTNAQINTYPGIDETQLSSELAEVILTIKNAVTYGGYGIVIVLAIVSIIVISNTIRLTVFARRREISIMKYVGATNSFIRTPFFIEGMTVGAIAGLLSCGAVLGAYKLVYDYVSGSFNILISNLISSLLTPDEIWAPLLAAFLVGGILIGGLGSATSVRKHLKV